MYLRMHKYFESTDLCRKRERERVSGSLCRHFQKFLTVVAWTEEAAGKMQSHLWQPSEKALKQQSHEAMGHNLHNQAGQLHYCSSSSV